MGNTVTHFTVDEGDNSLCGRSVQHLKSSTFADDVTCKRCVKRLEEEAESDAELRREHEANGVVHPSTEQVYLLGSMERYLKRVQLICLTEDSAPTEVLERNTALRASIYTVGVIIQDLYPGVGYVGQTVVQNVLKEEGWPIA